MLLTNFIVELDLKNGSVGEVIDICYENSEGPRDPQALPLYVVVDFPDCTIPPESAWDPEHPTWVPVPVFERRCESKCCFQRTIPLRVCKALTIYKSQGMTVGPGHFWEKIVIKLPAEGERRTPGEANVAFSRATDLSAFAILDDPPGSFSTKILFDLGKGDSDDRKRLYEKELEQKQAPTQAWLLDSITQLDVSQQKTFDGGFQELIRWYRTIVPP